MSQTINLLTEELRPKPEPLSLPNLLAVLGIVIVLIVLVGLAASAWLGNAQRNLAAQTAQANQLQAEVDRLTKEKAARVPSPALLAQLEVARRERDGRRELLRRLDDGDVGHSDGFSGYLTAFARRAPAGLWLTGFSLQSGGQTLIEGKMQEQKLVSMFALALQSDPVFAGRRLSAVQVAAIEPETEKEKAARLARQARAEKDKDAAPPQCGPSPDQRIWRFTLSSDAAKEVK
ncbi:MAG: PilN domain-containing protein [Zoogloeaceae bacterium]|jgi:Tfp pilus assembly protein PilN|nr:PilN domain-containing protein [Zoogloeaceae bacterium]